MVEVEGGVLPKLDRRSESFEPPPGGVGGAHRLLHCSASARPFSAANGEQSRLRLENKRGCVRRCVVRVGARCCGTRPTVHGPN